MGNFARLVRQTKEVEIHGVNFTLKKWTVGFKETVKQFVMENGELDTKNNKIKMVGHRAAADNDEMAVDKIMNGVKAWALTDEDTNDAAPVNAENIKLLVNEYPDTASVLIAHIENFNRGVMEDEETKNL